MRTRGVDVIKEEEKSGKIRKKQKQTCPRGAERIERGEATSLPTMTIVAP